MHATRVKRQLKRMSSVPLLSAEETKLTDVEGPVQRVSKVS